MVISITELKRRQRSLIDAGTPADLMRRPDQRDPDDEPPAPARALAA